MSRIVAVACLLAFCATWLPHSHSESHSGLHPKAGLTRSDGHSAVHSPIQGVRSAMHSVECPHGSMASDDAHEEHSSHAAIESGPCLSCRSKDDRAGDRVRSVVPILGIARTTPCGTERTAHLPEDLAFGLHPPRAPPIG